MKYIKTTFILSIFLFSTSVLLPVIAQEYDDMYFVPSDRKKVNYNPDKITVSEYKTQYRSYSNSNSDTYTPTDVKQEHIDKYKQAARTNYDNANNANAYNDYSRTTYQEDLNRNQNINYNIPESYVSSDFGAGTVVNNYYYDRNGFNNVFYNDPFWRFNRGGFFVDYGFGWNAGFGFGNYWCDPYWGWGYSPNFWGWNRGWAFNGGWGRPWGRYGWNRGFYGDWAYRRGFNDGRRYDNNTGPVRNIVRGRRNSSSGSVSPSRNPSARQRTERIDNRAVGTDSRNFDNKQSEYLNRSRRGSSSSSRISNSSRTSSGSNSRTSSPRTSGSRTNESTQENRTSTRSSSGTRFNNDSRSSRSSQGNNQRYSNGNSRSSGSSRTYTPSRSSGSSRTYTPSRSSGSSRTYSPGRSSGSSRSSSGSRSSGGRSGGSSRSSGGRR